MRRPRRDDARSAVRRSGPAIAALTALAISQPLLDLFGRNPEFFVAQSMTTTDIVVFAVAVSLGVPLALVSLLAVGAAISERVGRVLHRTLLGLLAGTFALVLLGRDQTSLAVAAALAVVVGSAVVVAEDRYDGLRTALRYLSPLPVLVLALFLFGSETSRLVWTPEAAAAPAEVVASPAPVTVLVFDELPLASLMNGDGEINAERFPNFARLADSGTWYRNATSPYPRTEAAVPAILSGTAGELGKIPSTIDHPRNLFTMLADSHIMNVEQEVTALCPEYACGTPTATGSATGRTMSALNDATVVFGHRVLPESVRDELPPVNQSWGGFAENDSVAADPFAARRDDPAATQTPVGKLAYFDRMIGGIEATDRPGLNVAHGVFPHAPWTLTPQGNAYGSVNEGLDFDPRLVWTDDAEVVLHGQIQHLLQLGAADAAVGRLIDKLEATGQWDESLVAVVADHGAAFEAGGQKREPSDDNLDEIFRVPLIVKYPGGDGGEIDDEVAQTTDLVPTIADALDVEIAWEFDGRSLLDENRASIEPTAVLRDGSTIDLDPSAEPLIAIAERNHERFPHRDDWLGVVAIGEAGAHVGRSVTDYRIRADAGWTWTTDRSAQFEDVGDGFVPIQFDGTIRGADGATAPDDVVVAVNGTIGGVGTRVAEADDGVWTFRTIVAEELFIDGANTVELYLADGADDVLTPVGGTRDVRFTVAVDDDGRPTEVRRGAETLAVDEPGDLRLEIEDAVDDGRTITVGGWSADADEQTPIDIFLVADGTRVSSGVQPYPALAEPEGALASWGFQLNVASSSLDVSEGRVVAVFEDEAVAVPVSWSP